MRPRLFFVLASLAFGLVAAGGVLMAILDHGRHDLSAVLLAGLSCVAFAAVAWIEPAAPKHACGACGGPTLLGLGFCTACGQSASESRTR